MLPFHIFIITKVTDWMTKTSNHHRQVKQIVEEHQLKQYQHPFL
ncbi:hypothetical protein [Pseudalkalibacillus caeni]|nr:hypothetical protein [Pseudalkalibacillus caeni]